MKNLQLDYSKITSVSCANIKSSDYPDFCDAYIDAAEYDGREMTEEELDLINEDREFVYESVIKQVF